ncbi:DUF6933 domain-containing protein [Eubacterium aggregans]|uniref:DUF6933 domain-containing protein n=1 Tax=Eubacterium aggregans TaxID=81409 RepID=UPI003F33356D
MELGMTIPLQKFIKASAPPYGIEENALFCCDVHVVEALESQRLFIGNAQNRFTVVLGNMAPGEWQNLTAVVSSGIETALRDIGAGYRAVSNYFNQAGPALWTKTHGRSPVAGLNHMVKHYLWRPLSLVTEKQFQREQSRWLNRMPFKYFDYRCTEELMR